MTTQPPLSRARRITLVTALIIGIPYLIALLLLTLWPRPVEQTVPGTVNGLLAFFSDVLHWRWLGHDQLEVISNVVVFVPAGILAFAVFAAAAREGRAAAFAAGPALSIAIEAIQGLALPRRTASFLDIAANSLGATIGVCLAWAAAVVIRRRIHRPVTLETP